MIGFSCDKRCMRCQWQGTGWLLALWEQVTLEFPVDDTAGGDNEDALTDMVFYVPREATGFVEDGEDQAAKVGFMSDSGMKCNLAPAEKGRYKY